MTPAVKEQSYKFHFLVLILAAAIAPIFLYPIFLMKLMCFALFAAGFNLLLGQGRMLSFGHAAFFGFGAYVSAHSAKEWGFTPELAILAALLTGVILGAIVGFFAITTRGIYFAMITLAFAQMIYFLALQAPFTGGENGLQNVPRGFIFGLFPLSNMRVLYIFVAVICIGGIILIHRIVNSPFGEIVVAIRDNEQRASSLGYNIFRYKLALFVMSAVFASLAGGTKALVFRLASLNDVHWHMSGEAVLMTLVGGIGTVFGPIVGAAVIVSIQNYLAEFGGWVFVIQGVIFMICVMLFREGFVGLLEKWTKIKL